MEAPSPEHILAYASARRDAASTQGAKKLRRVLIVGNIDAWSTMILGALSLVVSVITLGWAGIILGVAMAVLGWRQLQATQSLRQLVPDAPRQMAINQLLLCAAVCLYSGWSLYSSLAGPSELDTTLQQNPELAQMVGGISGMENTITITVYAAVIAGSIIVMGSTAWYYYKKSAVLELYISQTPAWIVDAQRRGELL